MGQFAELDNDYVIRQIVVISDDHMLDQNGGISEECGKAFCVNLFGGGTWIQTFPDGSFRGRAAEVGGTYDPEHDVFIWIRPFSSWQLDENFNWVAPIPKPDDNLPYYWDETTTTWIGLAVHEDQVPPVG